MSNVEGYCQWCGKRAPTTSVIVTPAEFRSVKGVKTQVHAEVRADSCEACAAIERQGAPSKEALRARRAATTKKWKAALERLPL